jgi:hypothetical protein
MANKNLFSTKTTAEAPVADTVNEAGGSAYAFGPDLSLLVAPFDAFNPAGDGTPRNFAAFRLTDFGLTLKRAKKHTSLTG